MCVFCGSSYGAREEYRQAAVATGQALLANGLGLVYGGGHVGLMGVIAETVMKGGGEVIGVIPRSLYDREIAYEGVTRLHVVEGMHPRKAKMAELSNAFIALPGGFGTFEELFEAITWLQLGYHSKPIGVLDVAGYFGPFLSMVDSAVREGFIRQQFRGLFTSGKVPAELVQRLLSKIPARDTSRLDLGEL